MISCITLHAQRMLLSRHSENVLSVLPHSNEDIIPDVLPLFPGFIRFSTMTLMVNSTFMGLLELISRFRETLVNLKIPWNGTGQRSTNCLPLLPNPPQQQTKIHCHFSVRSAICDHYEIAYHETYI